MPQTAFGVGVLLGGGIGAAWLTITTRREVARLRRRLAWHRRQQVAWYTARSIPAAAATRRAQGVPGRS